MTLTSKDITFTPGNHRYHVTDSKPRIYLPSVTTVCGLLDKPFLIQWAANVAAVASVQAVIDYEGPMDDAVVERLVNIGKSAHREVREEGGNVGTAVHTHVKSVLMPGWTPPEDEIVDGGIEAEMAISCFDEWYQENIVDGGKEILLVEQMAVHPESKYIGTLDLCVLAPDECSATGKVIEVVDWKTSNQSDDNPCALYPEYFYQIAAYRRLLMLTSEFDKLFGPHPFGGAQQVSLGKNGQLAVTHLESDDLDEYADAFETLVTMLGTHRKAQAEIRAFNKAERIRRENLAFEKSASANA